MKLPICGIPKCREPASYSVDDGEPSWLYCKRCFYDGGWAALAGWYTTLFVTYREEGMSDALERFEKAKRLCDPENQEPYFIVVGSAYVDAVKQCAEFIPLKSDEEALMAGHFGWAEHPTQGRVALILRDNP